MTIADRAADEAEIRQLVDSWARDLCARDVDALPWEHAPDARAFDMERWFASWPGSAGREMRYLTIATDGAAHCHCLNRIRSGMWVRATVGLRKIEGKWQVTRERISGLCDRGSAGGDAVPA